MQSLYEEQTRPGDSPKLVRRRSVQGGNIQPWLASRYAAVPHAPCHDTKPQLDGAAIGAAFIPSSLDRNTIARNHLLQRPDSRKLLHHYIHRTNKAIAVCQGRRNPFLTELLPIVMSNDLILNAILTCSGIQHADLSQTSIHEVTWIHYGQAVQGQKFGLSKLARSDTTVLLPLLVNAVLLCIAEVSKTSHIELFPLTYGSQTIRENSGAQALYHLKAARALLQQVLSLPRSELSDPVRAFLIERCAYATTLAHINMGPESDEWVLEDTELLFPLMQQASNGRGETLSCVHELFCLISRVSILARMGNEKRTADQG
jgi:hypothetical protein